MTNKNIFAKNSKSVSSYLTAVVARAFLKKTFKCMFKQYVTPCSNMVKTITIRDEVYKKLLSVKGKDESFSELFERLAEGISPVETLTKLRGCVEFVDKEKMLSEIYASRAERRL